MSAPILPVYARSWAQTRFLRAIPEFAEIVAAMKFPGMGAESSGE